MLYLVGTGAQHSRPRKMVGESGPEPSIKDRAGPLVDVWFWISLILSTFAAICWKLLTLRYLHCCFKI